MNSIQITLEDAPMQSNTCVGVFASYTEVYGRNVLKFYGWGTYEGDFPIGVETGGEEYATLEEKKEYYYKTGNACSPRIRMDDGTVTWGSIVWFDTREYVENMCRCADIVEHVDLATRMETFNYFYTECLEYSSALAQINTSGFFEA